MSNDYNTVCVFCIKKHVDNIETMITPVSKEVRKSNLTTDAGTLWRCIYDCHSEDTKKLKFYLLLAGLAFSITPQIR